MKINGKQISRVSEKVVPILRGEEEIFLIVKSLEDWDYFNKICPEPNPPRVKKVGEAVSLPDFNDKKYIEAINEYASRKVAYLVIRGLEATKDLVWEKVKISDPTTYKDYIDELLEAGLTDTEVGRIVDAAMEVNGLNEGKIEEAKKRFLAQAQEVKNPSTSLEEK